MCNIVRASHTVLLDGTSCVFAKLRLHSATFGSIRQTSVVFGVVRLYSFTDSIDLFYRYYLCCLQTLLKS